MAGYLSNLLVRLGVDPSDLNSGLDRATRSVKKFGQDLTSVGQTLALGITVPIAALAGASIKAAADMESLKMALTTITGSGAETTAQLVRLKEVAKLPGLGFQEAVQGSINLQAAGFSAALAERSLKAFGNALATVGKGRADLEGVNLVLTQIVNKPKVMAQDLNQLRERLPQISQMMKAAFGTSVSEDIQKLGVTGQQFVEIMIAQFEKLPKVSVGFKTSLETLQDTMFLTAAEIGNILLPLAQKILDFAAGSVENIKKLATAFSELSPTMQNLTLGTVGAAAAFPLLAIAIGSTITNVIAISSALKSLGAVMQGIGGLGFLRIAGWVGVAVAIADATHALWNWHAANEAIKQGVKDGSTLLLEYEIRLRRQGVNIDDARKQYNQGIISLDAYRKELDRLRDAHLKLHPVAQTAKVETKAFGEAAEAAAESTKRVGEHLEQMTEKVWDAITAVKEQGITFERYWTVKFMEAAQSVEAFFTTPIPLAPWKASMEEATGAVKDLLATVPAMGRISEAASDLNVNLDKGNIPKLTESYEDLAKAQASGAISMASLNQAYINLIKAKSAAGQATVEEIALAKQLEEASLAGMKNVAKARYDLGRELEQMSHRTFDSLERDLAKNIVSWKGWADTIKNVGKGFAEDFLSIMMKALFKPLEDEFAKIALKIGTTLSGVFTKSAVGGMTPAMEAAGNAAQTAAINAATGGAGAAASVGTSATTAATQAVTSSLAGIVTAVAGVATAISSIVGNFQMAGMNKSLDLIVNHTLRIFNSTEQFRMDAWERETHLMLKLDDIWGAVRNIGGGAGPGNSKQAIQITVNLDGKAIWSGMQTIAQLSAGV